MLPETVDLTDPDAFARGEHHRMFARLRDESPVSLQPEPGGPGYWAVTRHRDVVEVNRDATRYSSIRGVRIGDDFGEGSGARQMMIVMDPPAHTRYRRQVSGAFTPRQVARLDPMLRAHVRDLLGPAVRNGGCDFVADVAGPLPLLATCDMLGIDHHDRPALLAWADRLVVPEHADPGEQQAADDQRDHAARSIHEFGRRLVDAKARDPGDDLTSRLLQQSRGGDGLTEDEIVMFVLVLFIATAETTRNAAAHGLLALLRHPDQLERLRGQPALLPGAIEEILRWSTPIHHFRRTATTDHELGGRQIRAGDKVVIWYASANRDDAVFTEPDRFDITRQPNDHVAFGGGGPHYCLGAALARLELRILFEETFARIGHLELAGPAEMLRSTFINGVTALPLRCTPTRAAP